MNIKFDLVSDMTLHQYIMIHAPAKEVEPSESKAAETLGMSAAEYLQKMPYSYFALLALHRRLYADAMIAEMENGG